VLWANLSVIRSTWVSEVQEEYYEKHRTESLAYGGGSDSCGGPRPAQAGKPDDRYRHHQG